MCGEEILLVAVRCKHCQADLREVNGYAPPMGVPLPIPPSSHLSGSQRSAPTAAPPPPPPAPAPAAEPPRVDYFPPAEGDFEQRFLDFAFKTTMPINGASVAYALKIPIDEANDKLEDLAARDVLIREVDARGAVFFQLPGRPQGTLTPGVSSTSLSPYAHPPQLLYDPPSGSTSLTRTPTESTALAGLLVNVLFLPGLGSLIGGKTSAGIFQLLMFLLGVPLCLVVIGVPMALGAWIWGLVTGVNMLSEAKQNAQLRGT
jgi:TM2 domain-containing membrane protein YozV